MLIGHLVPEVIGCEVVTAVVVRTHVTRNPLQMRQQLYFSRRTSGADVCGSCERVTSRVPRTSPYRTVRDAAVPTPQPVTQETHKRRTTEYLIDSMAFR